eukprot:scaffold736_cov254-Pinguiococcus_pyrenoidosus.AAC.31
MGPKRCGSWESQSSSATALARRNSRRVVMDSTTVFPAGARPCFAPHGRILGSLEALKEAELRHELVEEDAQLFPLREEHALDGVRELKHRSVHGAEAADDRVIISSVRAHDGLPWVRAAARERLPLLLLTMLQALLHDLSGKRRHRLGESLRPFRHQRRAEEAAEVPEESGCLARVRLLPRRGQEAQHLRRHGAAGKRVDGLQVAVHDVVALHRRYTEGPKLVRRPEGLLAVAHGGVAAVAAEHVRGVERGAVHKQPRVERRRHQRITHALLHLIRDSASVVDLAHEVPKQLPRQRRDAMTVHEASQLRDGQMKVRLQEASARAHQMAPLEQSGVEEAQAPQNPGERLDRGLRRGRVHTHPRVLGLDGEVADAKHVWPEVQIQRFQDVAHGPRRLERGAQSASQRRRQRRRTSRQDHDKAVVSMRRQLRPGRVAGLHDVRQLLRRAGEQHQPPSLPPRFRNHSRPPLLPFVPVYREEPIVHARESGERLQAR